MKGLFHAVADASMTQIPEGVIEASINSGIRRTRQRRRRVVAGVATVAAIFGGGMTYAATAFTDPSSSHFTTHSGFRELTVRADRMAETLATVYPGPGRATKPLSGATPGELSSKLRRLGYPADLLQPMPSARTGFVVLERTEESHGDRQVDRSQLAIRIEKLDTAQVEHFTTSLCESESPQLSTANPCTTTVVGLLSVRSGENDRYAAVSLLTPDRWLISVATTTDDYSGPVGVTTTDLTQIALNEVWWK